jgi:hypothetical protein
MLRTLSSHRAPELGLVRATFESPVFGPPDWRVRQTAPDESGERLPTGMVSRLQAVRTG